MFDAVPTSSLPVHATLLASVPGGEPVRTRIPQEDLVPFPACLGQQQCEEEEADWPREECEHWEVEQQVQDVVANRREGKNNTQGDDTGAKGDQDKKGKKDKKDKEDKKAKKVQQAMTDMKDTQRREAAKEGRRDRPRASGGNPDDGGDDSSSSSSTSSKSSDRRRRRDDEEDRANRRRGRSPSRRRGVSSGRDTSRSSSSSSKGSGFTTVTSRKVKVSTFNVPNSPKIGQLSGY